MTGLEYILLHVQEPILYVIRKQHRHTPAQATPIADYYIIAGIIYQAPDLNSVLNSRLVRRFFTAMLWIASTISPKAKGDGTALPCVCHTVMTVA